MIVRVLGSAAGGGVPQWNCACANCRAARAGTAPRRSQSGFAVSADGERWWLVNVSPDIAHQIEAFPALVPRSDRGTPIAGMLLTDANVDHAGGFAVLRQMGDHAFTVVSSATIREVAAAQPAAAPFARPPHRWRSVEPGESVELDGPLGVRVVPVAGTTPGYDGRRSLAGAVVAYHVTGADGAGVLFAPVFAAVDATLVEAVRGSRVAFCDGSFWSDDELGGVGVAKTARALGHLPIGGPDGSLERFAAGGVAGRVVYAHLNNTNPVLAPGSAAAADLARAGARLASDGLELIV